MTGYVATDEYESRIRGDLTRLDLSEAIAISGAAISPGHVGNPFIAFLMFLLNLRLGQWLPNPRCQLPMPYPTAWSLLWSTFKKPEDRRYCFLTDGGNSENLGLIQLLQRRCKVIIAVDAGCDPDHDFNDLSRVIRNARIHGGVQLVQLDHHGLESGEEMDLKPLQLKGGDGRDGTQTCDDHFVFARILYPARAEGEISESLDSEPCEGLLVYVKPSFTGDESVDLKQYRRQHAEFPHESTSNQLYEEPQVESYRKLGYHIGTQLGLRLRPFLPEDETDLWECGDEISGETLAEFFERSQSPPPEQVQEEAEPVTAPQKRPGRRSKTPSRRRAT